jgi:1-acyl-sn-glycerol-3-phosphate acyltransferase
MTNVLPGPVLGAFTLLLYVTNTVFWTVLLLLIAPLKFIMRSKGPRNFFDRLLNGVAGNWIAINNLNMRLTRKIRWDVEGTEALKRNGSYLVVANHQSWVDILVLQKVLHRKIPPLKFFLKKELIWVPFLGLAWWALDFPFMKRYSRAYLEKHPDRRGRDMEITRKACEKFRTAPVAIMNFVEGTRYTMAKSLEQQSPHMHLLRPKAAGVAFVLATMGEQLQHILDVTIAYPEQAVSFWGFLCGRVNEISVRVERLPVSKELLGDYLQDAEFRGRFQDWLNDLWTKKDRCMDTLLHKSRVFPVERSS